MKLARRHRAVLAFLAGCDDWCAPPRLPDGNGRNLGANPKTLKELGAWGLIEYRSDPDDGREGYRITESGRAIRG